MTIRLRCCTQFDITATGIKGGFNINRIPCRDASGEQITNDKQWTRSRNKQRNWETLNQIISLRTLPENITIPVKNNQEWSFEFDVVDPESLRSEAGPLGGLRRDCEGVPMILGLDESPNMIPVLQPHDADANVWFEIITDK